MEPLILKILLPALVTFTIGILITPLVTHYLYAYKAWKKNGGKTDMLGETATEFNRLKAESETKTPRMGGIVIWGSVILAITLLFVLTVVSDNKFFSDVFFLSRSQTWIPFFTFCMGAGFGFLNDFYDVQHGGKGVRLSVRLLLISILSGCIGWWFYAKLGVTDVNIPFGEPLYLGIFIIPFFILLTNAVYASGVIDGIDGLSGGVFATVFAAYAGIAIMQSQYDLAAFCVMLVGAILAFLWFNIPPARFWMTETGSMPLTLTLAVILFMTDSLVDGYGISLFFIVGFVLIATVVSNIVQISYRKLTGRKLFRIAPLHHHFEAIGWPSYKVTMRYWIISSLCAVAGLIIAATL
jgi:phospho-N-acetylmuramoyl-pentapeptide-transferase